MLRGLTISPWLLVASCILASSVVAEPGSGLNWHTDYNTARRQAMLENKIIVVNIHATWCGPCRLLQSTTLQNPDLIQTIATHCIPLSLDGDHHPQLIGQWGVNAFPTQLFLAPSGEVIGRLVGYVGVPEYKAGIQGASNTPEMRRLRALVDSKLKRPAVGTGSPQEAKPPVVESRPLAGPKQQAAPAFVARDRQPEIPISRGEPEIDNTIRPCDATVPVAMGGFCPVSMIVRAELTQGSDANCLVYRGKRFLFRTTAERTLFLENPKRYLPAEDGYCVVTWAEEHRWTPGAVKYPAIFGEHVFLFPSNDHRQKFLEDPERYVDATGRAYRSAVDSATRDTTLR